MGLVDFAELPADGGARGTVANNRRLARYQRKWMRRIAGSRPARRRSRTRRRRGRDRRDRASRVECCSRDHADRRGGLAAAPRRSAARACARSRRVHRDVRERVEPFPTSGGAMRATPSERQASFGFERDGRFDGLVSCFVADDPATVFLVAMWVAPELRGTGAARELVESVLQWARERAARARVPFGRGRQSARGAPLREVRLRRDERPAAVPVRRESRAAASTCTSSDDGALDAHGNVYLVTEEPLDAERVRRDVGDADGIVAGRRARRRLGRRRHLEPRRLHRRAVGQRDAHRGGVARRASARPFASASARSSRDGCRTDGSSRTSARSRSRRRSASRDRGDPGRRRQPARGRRRRSRRPCRASGRCSRRTRAFRSGRTSRSRASMRRVA